MLLCLLTIIGMIEPYLSNFMLLMYIVNSVMNFIDQVIVKTNTDKVYIVQNKFEKGFIKLKRPLRFVLFDLTLEYIRLISINVLLN